MDVIQQARRLPLGDDDWVEAALNPQAYRLALRAVVEAADEGHLIDARGMHASRHMDDALALLRDAGMLGVPPAGSVDEHDRQMNAAHDVLELVALGLDVRAAGREAQ